MSIRQFNKKDWYGWAGAEAFSEQHQPLITEVSLSDGEVSMTLIADRNGIQISFANDDDEEETLIYTKEMSLNSIRAEGELNHLVEYLSQWTYAPDITYELDHPTSPVTQGYKGSLY